VSSGERLEDLAVALARVTKDIEDSLELKDQVMFLEACRERQTLLDYRAEMLEQAIRKES
jgi:hypothetical protein